MFSGKDRGGRGDLRRRPGWIARIQGAIEEHNANSDGNDGKRIVAAVVMIIGYMFMVGMPLWYGVSGVLPGLLIGLALVVPTGWWFWRRSREDSPVGGPAAGPGRELAVVAPVTLALAAAGGVAAVSAERPVEGPPIQRIFQQDDTRETEAEEDSSTSRQAEIPSSYGTTYEQTTAEPVPEVTDSATATADQTTTSESSTDETTSEESSAPSSPSETSPTSAEPEPVPSDSETSTSTPTSDAQSEGEGGNGAGGNDESTEPTPSTSENADANGAGRDQTG